MWAEAIALVERAERLHRHFFQLIESEAEGPAWQPPVDIFETQKSLSVLIALPGVVPAHIQIAIHTGMLTVAGERRMPAEFRAADIHRLEIPYGRFERRIELPPGRFELDRQELTDGCLLLNLRKL
jgi:HSP20 family molecular chaperone IbpA